MKKFPLILTSQYLLIKLLQYKKINPKSKVLLSDPTCEMSKRD